MIKDNNRMLQRIRCIVIALFIVPARQYSFMTADVSDNAFALVPLFLTGQGTAAAPIRCVLLFLIGYAAIRYVLIHEDKPDKLTAALAALFAALYMLSMSYKNYDGMDLFIANGFQAVIALYVFVFRAVFGYFLLRTVFLLAERPGKKNMVIGKSIQKHFLLYVFLIIFICRLPWLIANYPASFNMDSVYQIQQYLGLKARTNHHPLFSTYVMGILFTIGESLGSANFGVFLYVLFQTCLGAFVFAYGLKKLTDKGASLKYVICALAFYALVPLWGSFAQWYEKSMLYAEIVVLYFLILAEIVWKRACSTKQMISMTAVCTIAFLLRNNGIYEVVPALIALVFWLKGFSKLRALFMLTFILAAHYSAMRIVYPIILRIPPGSVAEALSVPFQQSARCIAKYPDRITEEEKLGIDNVLPYEELADLYEPKKSDSVKRMYRWERAVLPYYFKTWGSMFLKYPGTYLSAFYNGTYGYLAPVESDDEVDFEIMPADQMNTRYKELQDIGIYKREAGLFFSLIKTLSHAALNLPLLRYFSMPGFYTWGFFLCLFAIVRKKKYPLLILCIPGMMNLLVCMASPLANAVRYELALIATLPFLLGWMTIMKSNAKRS